MAMSILHYVHYPLCGWCYAASPMGEAVANAGIPVVSHGGGLWETSTGVAPDKGAYIQRSDARIAAWTGVTLGTFHLDGLLLDADGVFWSRAITAAVLAPGAIEQGAGLHMLRAIHHAHYVEGRRAVEIPVLTVLAGSIGLAADFRRTLETAAVDDHIAATRRWMQQAGLHGFPSFLLERGAGLVCIEHEPFYGRPACFPNAIVALDPAST